MKKYPDNRKSKRLDLSFKILLLNQEGKTINISANGVYFEVIIQDLEAFAPGAVIPVEINAVTSTPGCDERDVKLKGIGSIVRSEVKDITGCGNRLGVGMKFDDALVVSMN